MGLTWQERFDARFDNFMAGEKIMGYNKKKGEAIMRPRFSSQQLKEFVEEEMKAEKITLVEDMKAKLDPTLHPTIPVNQLSNIKVYIERYCNFVGLIK